jgi:hypothetical protein
MRPPAPGNMFRFPASVSSLPEPCRRSLTAHDGKAVKQLFEKAFPFYIFMWLVYEWAVFIYLVTKCFRGGTTPGIWEGAGGIATHVAAGTATD